MYDFHYYYFVALRIFSPLFALISIYQLLVVVKDTNDFNEYKDL